jgi:hypothetical protein
MQRSPDILKELGNISKTLSEIPDKPVFSVPDDYFERFPDLMLLKAKTPETADVNAAAEIASLSPLLAGLSRTMPMKAPEGYFSRPVLTGQQEKEPRPAPVIPMPRHRLHRYAVAASVVAILGSAMLFLRISVPEKPAQSQVNISAELPRLSEKELDEFLTALPDLDAGTESIALASVTLDIEGMITEVDEKGLQEFLSEMPDLQTINNN